MKAKSASKKDLPPLRVKESAVIPFRQQARLPHPHLPLNPSLFRDLAVGNSSQSQQQPHPLVISNASGASSSYSRFN